jgi:mRNA-degrading endonuclease YafQ of YafQ-DinJ toxin-antitoxin module
MLEDMTVRGLRAKIKSSCFGWEKMTKEEVEEVGAMLADMHDLERQFKHHKEMMAEWSRITLELENFLDEHGLNLVWNGHTIVRPHCKTDIRDIFKLKEEGNKWWLKTKQIQVK